MTSPPADHLSTISPRAKELITTLNLTYLPQESGYIGLLGRSAQTITTPSTTTTSPVRALAAQSHNYYMLTSTLATNYVHWLEPDDTHILVEGGPVDYFIFHVATTGSSSATAEKITLGTDFGRGQQPVVAVPGGCWKALRLHGGASHALMVNVLSPEFTEDRVVIGVGEKWVEMFKGRAEWASEEFLRGLVTPDWVG